MLVFNFVILTINTYLDVSRDYRLISQLALLAEDSLTNLTVRGFQEDHNKNKNCIPAKYYFFF